MCLQDHVYPFLMPYLLPLIHVCLTGSVYTTIAVAVERCLTVLAPFTQIKVAAAKRTFTLSLLKGVNKIFAQYLEKVPTIHSDTLAVGLVCSILYGHDPPANRGQSSVQKTGLQNSAAPPSYC